MEADDKNVFVPLEDWDNIYLINKLGEIKYNAPKNGNGRLKKGDLVKICKRKKDGLHSVTLNNGKGRSERFLLRRLLALTFLPREEGKDCVVSANGNDDDYSLENLKWVGRKVKASIPKRASKRVFRFSKDWEHIETYNSAQEVVDKVEKVNKAYLRKICIEKIDSLYHGSYWRYEGYDNCEEGEVFKKLKEIDGLSFKEKDIFVSSHGKVREGMNNIILTHITDGKLRVRIMTINKEFHTFNVDRLVCYVFNGKYKEDSDMVNHKDGDEMNNYYENLEWIEPFFEKIDITNIHIKKIDASNDEIVGVYRSISEAVLLNGIKVPNRLYTSVNRDEPYLDHYWKRCSPEEYQKLTNDKIWI